MHLINRALHFYCKSQEGLTEPIWGHQNRCGMGGSRCPRISRCCCCCCCFMSPCRPVAKQWVWFCGGYRFGLEAVKLAAQLMTNSSDSRPYTWTVCGWAGTQKFLDCNFIWGGRHFTFISPFMEHFRMPSLQLVIMVCFCFPPTRHDNDEGMQWFGQATTQEAGNIFECRSQQ